MAFLTKAELKTKAHIEIINAITRSDDAIIDMIIDENISYMKSFLRARYNVDQIFSKTGTNRNNVVLKILKDLVIFEIYSSTNPVQLTTALKESRERAENWLKSVMREEINPDLPIVTSDSAKYIQYGSQAKRNNSY